MQVESINTYTGITQINAGDLQMDGVVGDVALNGGTLSGNGTVGNVGGLAPATQPTIGAINPGDNGLAATNTGRRCKRGQSSTVI